MAALTCDPFYSFARCAGSAPADSTAAAALSDHSEQLLGEHVGHHDRAAGPQCAHAGALWQQVWTPCASSKHNLLNALFQELAAVPPDCMQLMLTYLHWQLQDMPDCDANAKVALHTAKVRENCLHMLPDAEMLRRCLWKTD